MYTHACMHAHTSGRDVPNLSQGCYCIGNYHRGRVGQQILQQVQETLILHQLGVDVMELGYAHSSRLTHVWIFILYVGDVCMKEAKDSKHLLPVLTRARAPNQGLVW